MPQNIHTDPRLLAWTPGSSHISKGIHTTLNAHMNPTRLTENVGYPLGLTMLLTATLQSQQGTQSAHGTRAAHKAAAHPPVACPAFSFPCPFLLLHILNEVAIWREDGNPPSSQEVPRGWYQKRLCYFQSFPGSFPGSPSLLVTTKQWTRRTCGPRSQTSN